MQKVLYVVLLTSISIVGFGQTTTDTTKSNITTKEQTIGFKPGFSPVEKKFSLGIQINAQPHEYGAGLQVTSPDLWAKSGVKLRLAANVMLYELNSNQGTALVPYEDVRIGILKSFELYETLSVYAEFGFLFTVNNEAGTRDITLTNSQSGPIKTAMYSSQFGLGTYLKCGIEVRPRPKYGVFFEMGAIVSGVIESGGITSLNFAQLNGGAPTFFANGYTITIGNRFYF